MTTTPVCSRVRRKDTTSSTGALPRQTTQSAVPRKSLCH